MKNRDYTLIVRDVPSESQRRIGVLLSALQENISVQGFGTAFKSEPSIGPEVWIVEAEQPFSGWQQSVNEDTRITFTTQAEAEAAIQKNWSKDLGTYLRYRAVCTAPTRFEAPALTAQPAGPEVWVVEYYSKSSKAWVLSYVNDEKKFHSKREAEAEFKDYKNSLNYRARQII